MLAVLRLGHRQGRDKRVTTHVALTARAFGADMMYLAEKDTSIVKSVKSLVERFGGNFRIEDGVDWKRTVKDWHGTVVHLTMYGLHLDDVIEKLPKDDVLIVVGAEKVPPGVFDMVDFNVAIGHQPHSEVAALAVFLDRLLECKGLRRGYAGRLRVVPSARSKKIEEST